eukprot:300303_1
MGKTFCEKHVLICFFFTILLIASSGFLFYAGWWLPIAINKHRLRHNQLVDFEIYTLPISNWYSYNIANEGISMVTYRQEKSYNYQYMLGSFQPENFSIIDLITDPNAPSISANMSGAIPITWESFSEFVDSDLRNIENNLYLTMYSSSRCININSNTTDIYQCFNDWYKKTNQTAAPYYYIYTFINKTIFVDVNSIHASEVLDGPRDVFMFIIMMFCFIWFFLVIDFFEDPEIGSEGLNYLVITLFFIGAYYLWIFVISVVPVLFSLPVGKEHFDYYRESLYSITYVIGNYDPLWWVAGVLLNGIWAYALVLFVPVIGVLYLLIATICCCNEEKTDSCGACIIIPVLLLSVCLIIIFTIGYYVLFIGNMVFWNDNTYNDMTNDNVIQSVTALLVFFILIPIMACCLWQTTKWSKKYDKKKKRKHIHKAGTSLQRLPIIKNRISANKKPQKKEKVYTDDEAIAMTQNVDNNTQQNVTQES